MLYKKVCYKELCLENGSTFTANNFATNKNGVTMTDNYVFYIVAKEIYKHDIVKNESTSMKIFGDALFSTNNTLFVMNNNTLTIFSGKNGHEHKNFTVQNNYTKVKVVEKGLIFIHDNFIDCILLENVSANYANTNEFYRMTITIDNVLDVDVSKKWIYFLTEKDCFMVNDTVVLKCNEYKHIGNDDIVKLTSFISIKKRVLLFNTEGFKRLFVDKNSMILTNSKGMTKYDLYNNNTVEERFVFEKENIDIRFFKNDLCAFDDVLVSINKNITKVLSERIFCCKGKKFLGEDKVFVIEDVMKDTYKCEDFSNNTIQDNDVDLINLVIDKNKITVPAFLNEEEKKAFLNFKVKVEKMKRMKQKVEDDLKRKTLIKEVEMLKNGIIASINHLKLLKEQIEEKVKKLSKRASMLKVKHKVDTDLLQKVTVKLSNIKTMDCKEIILKLKAQRIVLKDTIEKCSNKRYFYKSTLVGIYVRVA